MVTKDFTEVSIKINQISKIFNKLTLIRKIKKVIFKMGFAKSN